MGTAPILERGLPMRHAWGRRVGQVEEETLCLVAMEAWMNILDTHCGKEGCFNEIRVR